jgi:hypothetical protein
MRPNRGRRDRRGCIELDLNKRIVKWWLIKFPYWLGIAADALWAVALLYPPVFGVLTGAEGFSPDRQLRSVMSIGGVLMAGWAVLLVWAVRRPIERRFVILLTALVVAALFLSVLISVWEGNSDEYWILVKCVVLVAAMLISSSLAGAMDRTAADL